MFANATVAILAAIVQLMLTSARHYLVRTEPSVCSLSPQHFYAFVQQDGQGTDAMLTLMIV